MQQYDISVIIPIYNTEKYLNQCVDSVLAQTKKNIEIVLVDDGATDRCPEIVDDYAKKHKNVVAVHQKNGGLSAARIAGFKHASGKYIGWVDSDDFVKCDMYEKLFCLAEEEQADLVYCDYEFYPHSVTSKAKWFREYKGKRDWRFIDKNTSFCFKLMLKELLDSVNIITLLEEYGDYSSIVPMLEAKKIAYTIEKLYVYRVGHTSMSGGSFNGKVDHYRNNVEMTCKLKNIIIGKPYECELKEYFEFRYIYTLILLALVSAKNSDIESYRFAKSELIRVSFRKNKYLFIAVKESYGALKAIVLTQIITLNYSIAKIISEIAI